MPAEELLGGPNRDEDRHKQKIREALKQRLPTVITDKALITSPKGTKVTVPVTVLEDPAFRPEKQSASEGDEGPGMGEGKPGDIIGYLPSDDEAEAGGAGEDEGLTYGVEVDVDELADLIFESLHLPPIESDEKAEYTDELRPDSRQKRGVHLDKKATLVEHIKRAVLAGTDDWSNEDVRYREFIERRVPHQRAVVVFVRDASGSITEDMAYTAVAASWWIVKWLRRHYPTTEVRFILHGTEAVEATEEEFFKTVWMGGTYCSTGLVKAKEVLESYQTWSKYVIYYSDGDNFPSDRRLFRDALTALSNVDMFVFGELIDPKWVPGLTIVSIDVSAVAAGAGKWLKRPFVLMRKNITDFIQYLFGDEHIEGI